MHRGGPYWLLPRRAPFGRRAVQPPPDASAPTLTETGTALASQLEMYPFTSAGGGEKSRDSRVVVRAMRPESSDLPHARGTCLACYRMGTELLAVAAEACVAVFGRAH